MVLIESPRNAGTKAILLMYCEVSNKCTDMGSLVRTFFTLLYFTLLYFTFLYFSFLLLAQKKGVTKEKRSTKNDLYAR